MTACCDNPTASSSCYHQPVLIELSSPAKECADGIERAEVKVKGHDSHYLVLLGVGGVIQVRKWDHLHLCDKEQISVNLQVQVLRF